MDLEEMDAYYYDEIVPDARRDSLDPTVEPPGHTWLQENGHSSFVYALREHHGMTYLEFCEDVLTLYVDGDRRGASDEYSWAIDDDETIELLETWLASLRRRRDDVSEQTLTAKRSRVRKYVATYRDVNGTAPLVDRVRDRSTRTDEFERALAVFDVIDGESATDRSKLKYHGAVRQWYDWLKRRGHAAYNPVEELPEEYGWKREPPEKPSLSTWQVRALYDAARDEGAGSELLVLATCAWGLRASEVAGLHQRQFALEDGDPHIVFDDGRKNGPGTVALIHGVDRLEERLAELRTGVNDWSGHLFPSPEDLSTSVAPATVRRRFKRLGKAAGVTVDRPRTDDDRPTPHMARDWWYQSYLDAAAELAEWTKEVAAEQGSSDTAVVEEHYDDEDKRRQRMRSFMRDRLESAFRGGR